MKEIIKSKNILPGDPDLISGTGQSPGEGNGNPLQYSYLGSPMDRGAQRAAKESDTTQCLNNNNRNQLQVYLILFCFNLLHFVIILQF